MKIEDVLKMALVGKGNCSDIYIFPNRQVTVRVDGDVQILTKSLVLSAADTKELIGQIISKKQMEKFSDNLELDTSFSIPKLARFRVNVFMQNDGISAVLRVLKGSIPNPNDLGLEGIADNIISLSKGLVLVTGPTGSGKTTTLASLIDVINEKYKKHILTVEDPIEFVYESKNSVVTQREVGLHSRSFVNALKYALRQDPDVLLVGELRDFETISAAVTLAETGHLVFATLHTTDAAQTVDRIIDVFPPESQAQIRCQLASTLKYVICQRLLPKKDDDGRVAAREIMIVNSGISNLIREGKTHQINNVINTSLKSGMISIERALADLVLKNQISRDVAFEYSSNHEHLNSLIKGM